MTHDTFDEMLEAETAAATDAERNQPNASIKRVRRISLADFKRDTNKANVLIEGGWGKRGGTSMNV